MSSPTSPTSSTSSSTSTIRQFASCPALKDQFFKPPSSSSLISNTANIYSFVYPLTPSSPNSSAQTSPIIINQRPRSTTSADHHGDTARLIKEIIDCSSLYQVLGVPKSASFDDIRRAYLLRSRIVHPDKHPNNPQATEAFQRITSAYTTLKQPSSRTAYDISGNKSSSGNMEDTLYATFVQIWFEIVEGNFDSLITLVDLLKNGNDQLPQESIEVLLQSIRTLMQNCSHCYTSAKPGFYTAIDLYAQLWALPYLDVVGRLKLSVQLLYVLLNIPLTINTAAGGSALPNWSVSTLQAMISVLEMGKRAFSRIMGTPNSVRNAVRSAYSRSWSFFSHKFQPHFDSLMSWMPWPLSGPTCTTAVH